ncbi:two-component system response regulator [Azonexus sp.]|uniref:response regulator n=1 Tax=Azonexus sp. TaxID=1872668 RepID=UPI0035AFD391
MPARERPTILVVDDTPDNLAVVAGMLEHDYRVRVAASGERGLRIAAGSPAPDLILLDIMMPGMDGYQTLEQLRANPATVNIPVIFVTAMDSDADEAVGLALGAVDYIAKPIRPAILQARIRTQLELKAARDRLARENERLEEGVAQRTREIELLRDVALHALATLAEKRDNETGNHLLRTRCYIELLMEDLALQPEFAPVLTPARRKVIAKAAPLHDIGKVGIPDEILCKPGPLPPPEFAIMMQHAQIGADALGEAIDRVLAEHASQPQPPAEIHYALTFLEVAREIAGCHHEKWNGKGYPQQLQGEDIPLAARLMALADVFDALVSRRHYKPPFPLEQVVGIIREGRGTHFDPRIVDSFLKQIDAFAEIAGRLADPHPAD